LRLLDPTFGGAPRSERSAFFKKETEKRGGKGALGNFGGKAATRSEAAARKERKIRVVRSGDALIEAWRRKNALLEPKR
jgi:hypothetical protein